MRLSLIALFALGACATPVPAPAQQADAPACTAMDSNLPEELSDWNGAAPIATEFLPGKSPHAPQVLLALGKGYQASLRKKADVVFLLPPEKPGGSVSYSGLFWFTVETAGDYTVALGSAAWIDVVEDAKALTPKTFGHAPECTTIGKMMVYQLKAGSHALQVAGNGADTVRLLVTKKP